MHPLLALHRSLELHIANPGPCPAVRNCKCRSQTTSRMTTCRYWRAPWAGRGRPRGAWRRWQMMRRCGCGNASSCRSILLEDIPRGVSYWQRSRALGLESAAQLRGGGGPQRAPGVAASTAANAPWPWQLGLLALVCTRGTTAHRVLCHCPTPACRWAALRMSLRRGVARAGGGSGATDRGVRARLTATFRC